MLIEGRTGKWETVIGLEVHAQVISRAKLFSGAATAFGAAAQSIPFRVAAAAAAPPARGFNWFAYTFPAIAFAAGLVLVLMIFRQWRHRPPQLATASGPAVTPEMLENARSQIKREAQDD